MGRFLTQCIRLEIVIPFSISRDVSSTSVKVSLIMGKLYRTQNVFKSFPSMRVISKLPRVIMWSLYLCAHFGMYKEPILSKINASRYEY